MRKRWTALCLALLASLLLLSACSGKLDQTEWKAAGFVDEQGNEQESVSPNGAFSQLTVAFFEGQTGTLRMNDTNYTFSYKKKGDTLTVTLQDGRQVKIEMKKDTLYMTIGETTVFFRKKQ